MQRASPGSPSWNTVCLEQPFACLRRASIKWVSFRSKIGCQHFNFVQMPIEICSKEPHKRNLDARKQQLFLAVWFLGVWKLVWKFIREAHEIIIGCPSIPGEITWHQWHKTVSFHRSGQKHTHKSLSLSPSHLSNPLHWICFTKHTWSVFQNHFV